MRYSVKIDREACIACGLCYSMDPTHFEGDAAGKSQVLGGKTNGRSTGSLDDDLKEDAQRAADSCPVAAITVG
jgi:ferredoxin